MCQFFSFVTKGSKRYYFNWQQRQELLKSNPEHYEPDSHTSICHFHGLDDDRVNKYEYNPLTGKFAVDCINIKDDRALAEKWVRKLDFSTVVEPLRINKIIHPFEIEPPEITDYHIELLNLWASVRDSVWGSVMDSVWGSIGDSVMDSVWASVRDSVWDSVWASVRDSVWDSVMGYASDFFTIDKWLYVDHEPGRNPFNPAIELWKQGIVPSFDGRVWRLHTKNGIAWEGELCQH